jgi:hypothetical protein
MATPATTTITVAPGVGAAQKKSDDSPKSRLLWNRWSEFILTIVIFGAIVSIARSPAVALQNAWVWALLLLIAFVLVVGKWRTRNYLGALINNRNLMSLSRFQMIAWTVVVLSGFVVLAMFRIKRGISDPLNFEVDRSLWAAMGISLASLVGTPFLLNQKKDDDPTPQAVIKTAEAVNDKDLNANRQGTLYANSSPDDARFADVFEGDEVGNTAYVDVAKLQMFVLTIVLVVAYATSLWHRFWDIADAVTNSRQIANLIGGLPVLSPTQVTLLLISHAGYLTSKTVAHTATEKQGV